MSDKYEVIIGLEVHVQLKTLSKMFCACDNNSEGAEPNTNICPICMGLVGALPKMNKKAFEWALRTSLALHGEITRRTIWDRKSYFYPDLPKGFQISQFDHPLSEKGHVDLFFDGQEVRVQLTRLHLEEDAGKNTHPAGADYTLVDLNRAGTPLMEIVSEPDIRSPLAAKEFLKELQRIVRFLDVSYADMEKGHLRCDASISLRPKGDTKLYPRSEIKNLNSFRSVERALQYEYDRQVKLWDAGTPPTEETTVGWMESKGVTEFLRNKEGATDYRYFPDPDIPPVVVTDEMIEEQKKHIPILPSEQKKKLLALGLEEFEVDTIIRYREISDYFDGCVQAFGKEEDKVKMLTNWTISDLLSVADNDFSRFPEISHYVALLDDVYSKTITRLLGKTILESMVSEKLTYKEAKAKAQEGAGGGDLSEIVKKKIKEHPGAVEDFKNGKEKALNVIMGMVIKETKGAFRPGDIDAEIHRQI